MKYYTYLYRVKQLNKFKMENFTKAEIKKFKQEWGQSNREICTNLDLPCKGSDDILMLDYFWINTVRQWYPKNNSLYSEREQKIANYLRLK